MPRQSKTKEITQEQAGVILDLIGRTKANSALLNISNAEILNDIEKGLQSNKPRINPNRIINHVKKDTLLSLAVASGSNEAVDTLLDLGADVNQRYRNGFSIVGHGLHINYNLSNAVTQHGLSKDDPINTEFSLQRTLSQTEAITQKLIGKASTDVLKHPFNNKKNEVNYMADSLNSVVSATEANSDLMVAVIRRMTENGDDPLALLTKKLSRGGGGELNALNVLMLRGDTKSSDAVLNELTPKQKYQLLISSVSKFDTVKVNGMDAVNKMSLPAKNDETLRWFDAKFDEAAVLCNQEALDSDKKVDDYWEAELKKESEAALKKEKKSLSKKNKKKGKKANVENFNQPSHNDQNEKTDSNSTEIPVASSATTMTASTEDSACNIAHIKSNQNNINEGEWTKVVGKKESTKLGSESVMQHATDQELPKSEFEKTAEEFLVGRFTKLLKENGIDEKEFSEKITKDGIYVIPAKEGLQKIR